MTHDKAIAGLAAAKQGGLADDADDEAEVVLGGETWVAQEAVLDVARDFSRAATALVLALRDKETPGGMDALQRATEEARRAAEGAVLILSDLAADVKADVSRHKAAPEYQKGG